MTNLTARDEANLEKIAKLRAYSGKLRASVMTARNLLLRNEHAMPVTSTERDALTILSQALEIKAP